MQVNQAAKLEAMREWIADYNFGDCDKGQVEAMTEKELTEEIEKSYEGGLPAFINAQLINQ